MRKIFQIYDIIDKTGSIKFGGFTLLSGEKSPLYFDLKRIISYPREFDIITDILSKKVKEMNPDKIAGASTAGIPFATAISLKTNIPMIYVRRQPKAYGTRSQIEGVIRKNENILLIDDVATDGDSELDFVRGIKNAGAKIKTLLVLIDHEQGAKEKLRRENINLICLITARDIINQLYRIKRIDGDTFDEVINYLRH